MKPADLAEQICKALTVHAFENDADAEKVIFDHQGHIAKLIASVIEPKPLPMDIAPKDSTVIRLLVRPNREAFTSFEDSLEPYWTIGFNDSDSTDIDQWHFAGWSWCHDCITEGHGEPEGWLPLHGEKA